MAKELGEELLGCNWDPMQYYLCSTAHWYIGYMQYSRRLASARVASLLRLPMPPGGRLPPPSRRSEGGSWAGGTVMPVLYVVTGPVHVPVSSSCHVNVFMCFCVFVPWSPSSIDSCHLREHHRSIHAIPPSHNCVFVSWMFSWLCFFGWVWCGSRVVFDCCMGMCRAVAAVARHPCRWPPALCLHVCLSPLASTTAPLFFIILWILTYIYARGKRCWRIMLIGKPTPIVDS